MVEPLVSILVNCYNGEKYLCQAVESVLAQTYQNWEIVFWDNQSTDLSAEKFQEYAKNDDRLRYFYASKHTLLYEARNLAIKKTRGEFIAILDTDDWWHPRKLEMQIPLFKNQEVGMVYGNYWTVYNDSKTLQYKKKLPLGDIFNCLLDHYCIGMLTLVIRKSIFGELNVSFNKKYQIIGDFDFALSVAKRKKVEVVQSPVAYYRKHNESLTSRELDKPIDELTQWIHDSNLSTHQLVYVNYNLLRRISIKNLINKRYLKLFLDIIKYDLKYSLKIRCLLAITKFLFIGIK